MSHRLNQRLNTVGDEFEATRSALVLATGRWSVLHLWEEVAGQRLASFQLAERNLEATYVVRLFAEFEAILRAQYPHSRPGRPVPRRSYNLINSLGSCYAIPAAILAEVHRIREFRHSIAHADPGAPPVGFTDAVSWLNRYLAYIPDADVPA
jgi:hypothetical protein